MSIVDTVVYLDVGDGRHGFEVTTGFYQDGSLALRLVAHETGEPWGTLTRYHGGSDLDVGEVLVATHSENQGWAAQAAKAIGLEDTGRRVQSGWTDLEVWRWRE